MYKISKNKYLKIFLTIILSISITTGIMAHQKREVDAVVVAVPIVAIPIIKAMIAGGVTFLTVDAMLEAYNHYTGTSTYNTVSGNINDKIQQELNKIMDNIEVQELLNHHFPGGMKPDPNDPEWNNYKNLTLGTIAVSIADNWNDLKDFITGLFYPKSESSPPLTIAYTNNNYTWGSKVYVGKDGIYQLNQYTFTVSDNKKRVSFNGKSVIPADGKQVLEVAVGRYLPGSGYDYGAYYVGPTIIRPSEWVVPLNFQPFPEVTEFETEEVFNDPNHTWTNTETQQQEIMLPVPIEIVEYDEDQQKWIVPQTQEISQDQAQELLSPWVGKTHDDIIQEQKSPASLPSPEPTPDPTPEPEPTPDPYDPANPGDAPPGTGTPTEPGTGEEPPPDPNKYKIPDLFRFIFWIIILIIKLILAMIEFVIKFFRIPSSPHIIPQEAQDVVNYFKHVNIPGFQTSFHSIVTKVTAILLAFRFTKIFVNYFKGSAETYEKETNKIMRSKINQIKNFKGK